MPARLLNFYWCTHFVRRDVMLNIPTALVTSRELTWREDSASPALLFRTTREAYTSLIKSKRTWNADAFIKWIKRHQLQIVRSTNCVQFIAKYVWSSHLKLSVATSEINMDVEFGIGSPDTNTASAMLRVPSCIYENTRRHIPQQSSATPDIYGCKKLKPHTIITTWILPPGYRYSCKKLLPAVCYCDMSVGS
jgi:hypothetical protein